MMNDGTDVVGQDFRGLVEEAERDGSSLRDILLSEETRENRGASSESEIIGNRGKCAR